MSTADLHKAEIDFGGLVEVLGKHLYSTPLVAIRELVQNAHDACERRRLEAPSLDYAPRIELRTDPARHLLIIEDNGAGLTRDEIVTYLATIGRGYSRVLRATHDDAKAIGMFGLGFMSAYFVSKRVEVLTTSYREPERGHRFVSSSGQRYSVADAAPRPVGTRLELHLADEWHALAVEENLLRILRKYCSLLSVPLFVGELRVAVNEVPPPWRTASYDVSQLRQRRLELDFARRYESTYEPLCTLPVATPRVRGLLWVQDGASYDTSDQRNVSVYVRGMLVDDDARDLVPRYLGFVGGVLEADGLSPTASRESLQKDAAYEQVAADVREAALVGLGQVAEREPATFRRILQRHGEAMLGASLCDERLFELVADELKLSTTEGDLTLQAIKRRSEGKVHVSLAERGGYEETLARALKVPVVDGRRYAALSFCKRWLERHGGALVCFGTESGNAQLFRAERVEPQLSEQLEALFGGAGRAVVCARFAPTCLPLVVLPDHEARLKQRIESEEADKRIAGHALGLARAFTRSLGARALTRVYVNLDAPVIRALLDPATNPGAKQRVAQLLRATAALVMCDEQAPFGDARQALEELASLALSIMAATPNAAPGGQS